VKGRLMYCLNCGRQQKWLKTSKTADVNGNTVRVWKCGTCGTPQNGYISHNRQAPKELYFDIETCFNTVGIFDLKVRSGYVSPECILKPSFVICWAACWIGGKEIFSGVVSPSSARKGDDAKILKPLWELLNEADVVIGHNCDNFDIKKMNYRFLLHGLDPPEKYKTVDTLKVARKNFSAESNKMDYLSGRLNGLKKHDMQFGDWVDCSTGKPEALNRMLKYCKNDVKEGSALYQKMLGWIPVQSGQAVRQGLMR
jgi:DNA polymerase elongation subunit (family B)